MDILISYENSVTKMGSTARDMENPQCFQEKAKLPVPAPPPKNAEFHAV